MHPNRAFAWTEEDAMRAFVADRAFAQIAAVADQRPITAQAPLSIDRDGSVRFHLARANPIAKHLDGAWIVASVLDHDFYVSPDWYGTTDQVPTWNYRLVEVEGVARLIEPAALLAQLDTLSEAQERRLAPKPVWTTAKLSAARMAALTQAIVGFSIDAPVFRGAAKLGQNKSAGEVQGVVAALRALGDDRSADAMRRP